VRVGLLDLGSLGSLAITVRVYEIARVVKTAPIDLKAVSSSSGASLGNTVDTVTEIHS